MSSRNATLQRLAQGGNRIFCIEGAHEQSTIEVVRGRLDDARSSELLSFWAQRGALAGEAAQRRLPEVVCTLRLEGKVAGVSSAYPADVEMIGGRRFWIYRSLLDQPAADQAPAMIRTTFAVLEEEFDGEAESPIGLCIAIADSAVRQRHPELHWADPPAIYAGYLPDGRQLRVAYFKDAVIVPPSTGPTRASDPPPPAPLLPSGYHLQLFAEQRQISSQDIIDFWTSEGVVPPEEAQRRVAEILVVATDEEDRPVGISTTYIQRNEQLRAELWYTRVFVGAAHRRSGLAIAIACAARDHLVERYRTGADRRGIGIMFVVESEILKRFHPRAMWRRTQFTFIGEDARGSHIRVHYFPGALAPEPE